MIIENVIHLWLGQQNDLTREDCQLEFDEQQTGPGDDCPWQGIVDAL